MDDVTEREGSEVSDPGETKRKDKRKFSSIKRKKRKGFCGKPKDVIEAGPSTKKTAVEARDLRIASARDDRPSNVDQLTFVRAANNGSDEEQEGDDVFIQQLKDNLEDQIGDSGMP